LINQLFSTEGQDERRGLLHEHKDLINERFLKLMEAIVDDLRAQMEESGAELLEETVKDVRAMLQAGGDDASSE